MSSRPAHLADFERPPIVEVAVGVEFAVLQSMRQAHLGLYWARVRSAYPIAEDHPAIPATGVNQFPAFRVSAPGAVPPNRTIFASTDRQRFIQMQQDRFISNWRGIGENYPRFEAIRQRFSEQWVDFQRFVDEEGMGPILPMRVEVTYVNHMLFERPGDFLKLGGHLDLSVPEIVTVPSDIQLIVKYNANQDVAQGGALQLTINRPPQGPFMPQGSVSDGWQMTLAFTAPVGSPAEPDPVLPLVSHGREVIDHAFVSLTRDDIQKNQWGRI